MANLIVSLKGYQRQGSFPLDSSSVFATLALANSYVSTNPTAYAGQIIAVADEAGNDVKVYKIGLNESSQKVLQEISGAVTSVNGQTGDITLTYTDVGAAAANHNHDTIYSQLGHNHDDRYYTETEMDSLLGGKANTTHTHDDRYYTETEMTTLLAGKADASHSLGSHSDVSLSAPSSGQALTFNGTNWVASSLPEGSVYSEFTGATESTNGANGLVPQPLITDRDKYLKGDGTWTTVEQGGIGTETDPIFLASAAYGITSTNISNWNNAYNWGDHSVEGYLTDITKSMVEAVLTGDITSHTHSQYITSSALNDYATETYVTSQGYLTSESDPLFSASAASGIIAGDITNWDTAYGWGNHALYDYVTEGQMVGMGYLTSETNTSLSLTTNILTYTDETGTPTNIDLSLYLDDTNLARIVSGTYDSGTQTLIFTRDDESTFSIDASMFLDDTNLVTSVNGKVGSVTLTTDDISEGSTNLYADANATNQGNTFNGASQLVQLDATGKLPAIDGSQLTNLPSGSSTLADLTDTVITTPSDDQFLRYNGTNWVNETVAFSSSTPTQDTAPTSPSDGDLWWDSVNGKLKIYYHDGDSGQWVDAIPSSAGGSGTVTSVAMTVPTGLTVTGSPITESGSLDITMTSGYTIPTTAEESNWNLAYGWGDHSTTGYLTTLSLDGLSDAVITTPSDDQFLRYNGTEWVNETVSMGGSAADASYSNTTSGLTATNTQDAIDEVAGLVDGIETLLASI